MMKKVYNKLVRDRIPEIINASGNECVIEILSEDNYMAMCDLKLTEELSEYQESKSLEELADLMEVIYACAAARGYTPSELEAIRLKKQAERGGFSKRLLLKEVIEK